MSDRTFRIKTPPFEGPDVKAWENELKELFLGIGIFAPIVANGVYGHIDRSYTKSFCYAVGLDPDEILEHGVTPHVRSFLRHWRDRDRQTPQQAKRMGDRADWRRRLRVRYARLDEEGQGSVSRFLDKILEDSWGYHPGVHDGIDLISLPDVPIYAPVECKVIDVRASGWWGLGKPKDPILAAKGDGIVQLEILQSVGPFKKGHHIGLGHAENACVKVGQKVLDGRQVARTGFANAWHIHLMYNDGSVGLRGVGNLDPREIVEWSKHNI